jgi:hypothetical protein
MTLSLRLSRLPDPSIKRGFECIIRHINIGGNTLLLAGRDLQWLIGLHAEAGDFASIHHHLLRLRRPFHPEAFNAGIVLPIHEELSKIPRVADRRYGPRIDPMRANLKPLARMPLSSQAQRQA